MQYLFLSGPRAAGKTYTANQMAELDHDISVFDTGPVMRYYHNRLAPNIPISQWVFELEKRYGPKITCFMLAKQLKSQMKVENTHKAIIVGFRELIGIKYLSEILKTSDFGIAYIDASVDLLYANYTNRVNSKNNDKKESQRTYEDFCLFLKDEQQEGLSEIKNYVKDNNPLNVYIQKQANDSSICNCLLSLISNTKSNEVEEYGM